MDRCFPCALLLGRLPPVCNLLSFGPDASEPLRKGLWLRLRKMLWLHVLGTTQVEVEEERVRFKAAGVGHGGKRDSRLNSCTELAVHSDSPLEAELSSFGSGGEFAFFPLFLCLFITRKNFSGYMMS